ncbi:hypothetical protein TWF718_003751 [Orbilia javanica]|uniref:Uncharacterized protein n=1 Tax=Orbilia javanica TaxID=47235 RepID=A0AAN8RF28_9PEZI
MRPSSIKRAVPSLLLLLLAVNALPSGDRQDDGEPQGNKNSPKALEEVAPQPVQGRDIGTSMPKAFQDFDVNKRDMFGEPEDYASPHTELKSRSPDVNKKPLNQRGVAVNNIEKRVPEPNVSGGGIDKTKRTSESQEMKAKLRARAEAEREKEEYDSTKRKWEERMAHNNKAQHRNVKRLFQHGSPFQEYRNTVPASAYAADDGSFGHALSGVRRSLAGGSERAKKRHLGGSTEEELNRRDVILARLQELGYKPEDVEKLDPADIVDKLEKRGEAHEVGVSTWNRSPLAKRDISHHIACPGAGLMSSYGNILFSSSIYFVLISVFRAACFGCDCKAAANGFYMGNRPEGGCTPRLVENCQMAGCRCLDTWSTSDPMLINKPSWEKGSGDRPDTFSDVTYNPQTKTTYSDKYAAAAHVNEVTLDGFKKAKRHIQTPNLSHVGELFAANKRSIVSPMGEANE